MAFSPFDSIFRKYAGAYAGDDQFIAIVASGTYAESGWNPYAIGDNGHSAGLFQLHDQGAGAGLGEKRFDPDFASSVMVPRYADAYAQYSGVYSGRELASIVAATAERPLNWDVPTSAARNGYRAAYDFVTGSSNNESAPSSPSSGGTQGGSPSTPSTPSAPSASTSNFGESLGFVAQLGGVLILAIVLLGLGVFLLSRQSFDLSSLVKG